MTKGKIKPYRCTNMDMVISHLSYVDDMIVFTNSDKLSINKLKTVLVKYELGSGQKINRSKSFFIAGNNLDTNRKRKIADTVGFPIKQLPFTYSGSPIFRDKPQTALFETMINKITAKTTNWKSNLLNMAGKLTLVNSSLESGLLNNAILISSETSTKGDSSD